MILKQLAPALLFVPPPHRTGSASSLCPYQISICSAPLVVLQVAVYKARVAQEIWTVFGGGLRALAVTADQVRRLHDENLYEGYLQ